MIAIFLLNVYFNLSSYHDDLERAAKIEKYVDQHAGTMSKLQDKTFDFLEEMLSSSANARINALTLATLMIAVMAGMLERIQMLENKLENQNETENLE